MLNIWSEIQAENAADAKATLENEQCSRCGQLLVDHYSDVVDSSGRLEWRLCR